MNGCHVSTRLYCTYTTREVQLLVELFCRHLPSFSGELGIRDIHATHDRLICQYTRFVYWCGLADGLATVLSSRTFNQPLLPYYRLHLKHHGHIVLQVEYYHRTAEYC